MKFSTPGRLLLAMWLILIATTIISPLALAAQTPTPIVVPVALAPTQSNTPVELVALTLDAEITENAGRTLLHGNATFKLHNTDRLNDLQVSAGFPAWAGDPYGFDPAHLNSFLVTIDGARVRTLTPARADLKIGTTIRAVDWYTFTFPLAGDEKKTVRYDFVQDLGEAWLPRFAFGMWPAVGWKGAIGSARITVKFPHPTTLEQIIAYDPPNPEFDGQSLTWRFTTNNPTANPSLIFLRPSVWDDLNAQRRAVQHNPTDANARTALGTLLHQLAALDSPRRDSFAMQAIAELENAVRLDPTNRTVRQALGALYELRAGPASGPRHIAYLQLAIAQWEALPHDANARRQLAEDYFYLGLEAQTRREFETASRYFDLAQARAPNGAGPLFTPERMQAQQRTLTLAWARALIERGEATAAIAKARPVLGDAFTTQFTPPSFYVTHAQVTTLPLTRSIWFTLAADGAPDELLNTASGVVASLRNATDVDAHLVAQGTTVHIQLNVPFENREHLSAKLRALTQVIPRHAEWALVRAVLAPSQFEWSEADEWFTQSLHYREQVDLASACDTFNAQWQAINQNLASLANLSPNDEEAQLKRALLQSAQRGWQNALAFAQVTFRAGEEETRVNACTAKTITWSSSKWKIERVALAVLVIEALGGGILIWRWRSRAGAR